MRFKVVSTPESKEESLPSTALRGAARGIARAGEAVAGLPGDIASTALGLGSYLSSGQIPTYEQVQEKLPISLPTSQQIRTGVTQKLTGEYLEPQGESEKFLDEVVGDLATLLIPVKGKVPGVLKTAGKAIAGNIASWGAKEMTGGSELAGAGAKLGIMTLADFAGGRKSLRKLMNSNYERAEKILPETATGNAETLAKINDKLTQKAYSGHPTTDKTKMREVVKSIDNSLAGDGISIKDAWELKKDLNKEWASASKAMRPQLDELNKELVGIINKYGTKNPEFGQLFSQAEELYKGLSTNQRVKSYIKKVVPIDKVDNKILKGLLFGGGYYAGIKPAAGGLAIYQLIQQADLLLKSPTARRYYLDVLKHAAEQNPRLLARSVHDLNRVANTLTKEQKEGRFRVLKT